MKLIPGRRYQIEIEDCCVVASLLATYWGKEGEPQVLLQEDSENLVFDTIVFSTALNHAVKFTEKERET